MICVLCKQNASNSPVCDSCRAIINRGAIMDTDSSVATAATIETKPLRKYYHVQFAQFDTVVDSQDVASYGSVQRAVACRVQPWYFMTGSFGVNSLITITEFTHDEYTTWLRQ
jgi:hypothetical protein